MPNASVRHSVHIPAARAAIWDRLQEAETWAAIGPVDEVWEPRHDADGVLQGFRWSTRVGPRRYEGTARTMEWLAPERFLLSLDSSELQGRLLTTIASNGQRSSRFDAELSMRPKGMLASLFFSVIEDTVQRTFPGHIDAFAGRFPTR